MNDEFVLWAGIDWGNRTHQVCVLDHERKVILERTVRHTGEAIGKFADELVALSQGDPGKVAASIETTWGAIIETLLERGVAGFSINPKQLDRFRDLHTVAGAKSDSRDAFVLAYSLSMGLSLFHRLGLGEAKVVKLREFMRVHEDLRGEVVAHGNRLAEQLHRYYPQVLELGSVHNDPWLWELLKLAPHPDKAQKLSPTKVGALLKKHRIRRVTADQVIERIGSEPLCVAPGVEAACLEHIKVLLPRLSLAYRERQNCEKKIAATIDKLCEPLINEDGLSEHSDAAILMSFPGVGTIVGGTILAEASHILATRDLGRLRTQSGIAPVTKQSGKSHYVVRRLARNNRLHEALFHWSRTCVQNDMRSRQHYERLRAAGHRYGRALRGVGDRLLTVLISMLRKRQLYDPHRRGINPVMDGFSPPPRAATKRK